jgi:hypothetical protein
MTMLGAIAAMRRYRGSPAATPPSEDDLQEFVIADLNYVIAFDAWSSSPTYIRHLEMMEFGGASASIQFRGFRYTGSNDHRPLGNVPFGSNTTEQQALRHDAISTTFFLLVDGIPSATQIVNQPAKTANANPAYITQASFTLDLTGIAEGWHKLSVTGSPVESCVPYYCYVRKSGTAAAHTSAPIITDSYERMIQSAGLYYGMVPTNLVPTAKPLVARECPSFSTAVSRTLLFLEMLGPIVSNKTMRRPTISALGARSTMNAQSYHYYHMFNKYPSVHLLDGPRGVGCTPMLTHIMVDRHGGAYACDPWRVVRISPTGHVTTRAGYKHHRDTLPYWEDSLATGLNAELVGDWSAIPVERRGFHELWGLAFDLDSVSVPNLATGDPQQVNPTTGVLEHPHSTGPRLFVADTQNNRICLLTFDRDDFNAVPVITEFLTGLNDPWDCVWHDNVLYVSERKDDRIAAYNATTGAFIRVVVSGTPGLATVDAGRDVTRHVPLATIQAEDVVAPEGLFYQDGWLYYGSYAMNQVKRVNLTTDVVEVAVNTAVDNNSHYMKIALSDGTFGPRGTIFVSTWSNVRSGFPHAYLADGSQWSISSVTSSAPARGKGGAWASLGYSSAIGAGMGRLLCGHSGEGLVQISLALPSDTTPNQTTYSAGKDQWLASAHHLLHGPYGYGPFGLPLPWGQSAQIDYFLTTNGHTPP